MAFTSYSIENDRKFRAAIIKAGKAVNDLRVPFTLIAQDFYKSEKAIWALRGPGLYPDLAPSTKRKRERDGQAIYPILKRTGRLEGSMTNPTHPDAILRIATDELIIGTAVKYGIFHQSDKPRSKIPLRKFLFIGPESSRFAVGATVGRLERWLGIMDAFLEEAVA